MQPEIERVGFGEKTRYAIRYQCPWCGENSRIAAVLGVSVPPHQLAFVVVCEATHCRRPAMVIGQVGHLAYDALGHDEYIFGMEVHPALRPHYREKGVPADIARDFEEALACQATGFRYAAALVARRVLQAAARDVIGSERNNLQAEIDAIPAGRISDVLRESAHQVRLVGNDAAHADAISSEDVEHLMVFTGQLLDALYVQPAVLAEAQAKRPRPMAKPDAIPGAATAKAKKSK